jgi:multisubunit Na+/H+ antiporter MnhC subunit
MVADDLEEQSLLPLPVTTPSNPPADRAPNTGKLLLLNCSVSLLLLFLIAAFVPVNKFPQTFLGLIIGIGIVGTACSFCIMYIGIRSLDRMNDTPPPLKRQHLQRQRAWSYPTPELEQSLLSCRSRRPPTHPRIVDPTR